jgi:hypothetical protein
MHIFEGIKEESSCSDVTSAEATELNNQTGELSNGRQYY